MKVGSICSGIEAASQAAPDNWEFAFFSEIEKFPSAVLAHHYPDIPNLGDFTTIKAGDWKDVTLLCGGPPCQTFSIAGNRGGLNDDRGNLTLEYVRMMHDFADNGLIWGLYENVPGILSDKTNAFGSFLSGIVGGDAPLCPPDATWGELTDDDGQPLGTFGWQQIKWPSQGMVEGPRARAAWDVLDAQWFGLAQRRKRVFVVISFAKDRDPAKVLFERKGVFGNTPPSRKAGQRLTGKPMESSGDSSNKIGVDGDRDNGEKDEISIIDRAAFNQGANALYDPKIEIGDLMPALVARGPHAVGHKEPVGARMVAFGEYEIDETASTIKARDYKDATDLIAFSAKDYGGDATENLAPTMRAGSHDKSHANSGNWVAIAVQDGREIEKKQNGLGVNTDNIAYTLDKAATQAVAFKPSHYTRGKDGKPSEITPPLTADADKGDQDPVVLAPTHQEPYTLEIRGRDSGRELEYRDDGTANSLRASSGGRDGMGVGAVAFSQNLRDEVRLQGGDGQIAGALSASPGMKQWTYIAQTDKKPVYEVHGMDSRVSFLRDDLCGTVTARYGTGGNNIPITLDYTPYAVRRLTPVECERLMGFPDNFTLIDYTSRASEVKIAEDVERYAIRMGYDTQDENVIRMFMCPDGPRYKALGNSWAVPVVKWIFDRIEAQESALRAAA